jgi:hypothetical protein
MPDLHALWYRAQHAWYKRAGYPVARLGPAQAGRRALLAYLSLGLFWEDDDPRFQGHQNYRQSCALARLLAARGYGVDVVQYNDPRFVPSVPYDLIIAHPGTVSRRIQAAPKTGVRLCLRTGRHAAYVNQAAQDRYAQLQQRRNITCPAPVVDEPDTVYDGYDAVACFDGNGTTADTFRRLAIPVYAFRNHVNPNVQLMEKDMDRAGSGFVYMAAQFHILKGLDWLLEWFAAHPDARLYVCGRLTDELTTLFREELSAPNIWAMGHIHPASETFREVAQQAAWYISPSATDGFQGTALDAMAAGLIPMLSDACGVDTGSCGIPLRPCTLKQMGAAVEEALRQPVDALKEQSRQARAFVDARYQPRHVEEDWTRIVDAVERGG